MIRQTQTPNDLAAKNRGALKHEIIARAEDLGFAVVRFTSADLIANAQPALQNFVDQGRHGDMDWLARDVATRAAPSTLWDEARGIIVLGMRYTPQTDPMSRLKMTDRGNISVYALGTDYHDVIKKRLKQIGRWLAETQGCALKVFVDTAPVMEKPLAQTAGVGWQGKHTNLVSPDEGSWLFLGSIFTTLTLDADAPQQDQCGSCQRCLDICPTNAFPAPYQLDARRCISYLTIEHKGHIAPEFREAMGNRIYGCDDCLAVCPWNKFARDAAEAALQAVEDRVDPPLEELVQLDDAAFRLFFSKSPVKRTGRDRFVRNVLIAIGNSTDPKFVPYVEERLADASPLVRAMAVWALGRLAPTRVPDCAGRHQTQETDENVLKEWQAALTAPRTLA